MSQPLTIERTIHFGCQAHGRRRLHAGPKPQPASLPLGRIPRVARLMALALRLDERLRRGDIASYAEVAELGHVTRARVSQILNLLNLATDIQESLLFLPRTVRGRDPVIVRNLQPIASTLDWRRQRVMWDHLTPHDLRLREQSASPTATDIDAG